MLSPVAVAAATIAAIILVPLVVLLVVSAFISQDNGPKAPPVWKGGWPLVGHFLSFAANPLATIRQGYAACGPVFTMKFLSYNMTFLVGTSAHTPFFRANDEELSQNEPYKFMTPIFGRGIVFDAPPEVKDQQLRFVAGALKGSALRTYVSQIVSETEAFLDSWGESGEKDLLEEMSNLTILTASRCLLGREVRENLFGEVSHLLRELDEGINPIAIFYPNAPLPAFRRRDAARAELSRIFGGVIRGRREVVADKPDDMLQAFMDAEYKDGSRCTDDQITGMLLGVLFAGQHTSSITSTWMLLNLLHGKHSHFMNRAMTEQVSVLGAKVADPASVINMDSVQRLDFLHMCMKECLRQYPPLIMLMRKVHKPLTVGTHIVPENHLVFAPLAVSMNLPTDAPDCVFPHPERFDPDRFSAERKEDREPFTFAAFGGGKHGCLGEQFGYLQVKTIVSMVLRRFELTPVSSDLPKPNYAAMVVGPMQENNACRVRYRLRKAPTLPTPAGTAAAGAGAVSA